MTDKQIIKAFKCITYGEIDKCLRCPYDVYKECETFVYEDALDLIKRQQAEIEDAQNRLELWVKKFFDKKEEAELISTDVYKAVLEKVVVRRIRAEAIREFADKLKDEINQAIYTYYNHAAGGYYLAENCIDEIDNLVKEMVGGTDV